jgi:hypothetical protein
MIEQRLWLLRDSVGAFKNKSPGPATVPHALLLFEILRWVFEASSISPLL